MTVHWVNYDLNKSGQGYTELIAYLKSHDAWAKPLASSFLVKTDLTASELRDGIKGHIDANDSVLVVAVSEQNWASFKIGKKVTDWMKENM